MSVSNEFVSHNIWYKKLKTDKRYYYICELFIICGVYENYKRMSTILYSKELRGETELELPVNCKTLEKELKLESAEF